MPHLLGGSGGLGIGDDKEFLDGSAILRDGLSHRTADGAGQKIRLLVQDQGLGLPESHLGVEFVVAADELQ
jgi:hypothetical protein